MLNRIDEQRSLDQGIQDPPPPTPTDVCSFAGMSQQPSTLTPRSTGPYVPDRREALFNEGAVGEITEVQRSKSEVTSIKGIMLDLDPHLINPDFLPSTPTKIQFAQHVERWCQNHPTLAKAEIRMTGSGVHVLLWPDTPIVLNSTADQDRWDGVIKTIQGCLPTDPAQPGITACTRPIDSINSKNSASVQRATEGKKVTEKELLDLADQMIEEPVKTFCLIVFGSDSISPCPICSAKESKFTAYKHVGKCYECKSINLQKLLGKLYASEGGQR